MAVREQRGKGTEQEWGWVGSLAVDGGEMVGRSRALLWKVQRYPLQPGCNLVSWPVPPCARKTRDSEPLDIIG